MKIAILKFEHVVLSSVVGPYDIFSQINGLVNNFQPEIKVKTIHTYILESNKLNNEIVYDLIIIPAMNFNMINDVLANEKELIEWIKWQYTEGAEMASICLGAFILASTGLLDNKNATTHWMGADLFRTMFPKVNLIDDKIITDFDRIYTSGGAYSFTSLIIYLIDKYFGHETAVIASKVFLIHLHDSKQISFNILNLQKNHNSKPIQIVQEYIENNSSTNIYTEDLAKIANMTLRTFIRNFKKATGNTPYEYVQKARIENAKKLLEQNDIGIEQVCFKVGYSDFAAFRKVFKKNVGLTPSKYKKKYGKMFMPEYVDIK